MGCDGIIGGIKNIDRIAFETIEILPQLRVIKPVAVPPTPAFVRGPQAACQNLVAFAQPVKIQILKMKVQHLICLRQHDISGWIGAMPTRRKAGFINLGGSEQA